MELLILAALILLNSFFALSETALISSSRARLESMKSEGRRGAGIALKLLEKPENFLSAIQIGITMVGIVSGAYGGVKFSDNLALFLTSHEILPGYADTLSMVIVITEITYFSIVVGELVPKTFAMNNSEKISVLVAPVIFIISKITYPAVAFLSFSTNFILKLIPAKQNGRSSVTEDELRMMIKIAKLEGAIPKREAEIHQNLFRFFDRKAEQIMTRRNDIAWINVTAKMDLIEKLITESPHSKFPVCSENLDNTLGIITYKDFMNGRKKRNFSLKKIIRPVIFVQEVTETLKILERFKKEKCHFAMVIDEYGSVHGMITLHDLSENIFGNLPDIDSRPEPPVLKRNGNSYLIDGETRIETLAEIIDIEDFRSGTKTYSTIAGYILERTGRLPHTGDSIKTDRYKIEVVDMDGMKIDKVLITKLRRKKKSG